MNLGSTNTQRIDLALKVRSIYIISSIHCLTSLKMWRIYDVIQAPSVQPAFVYFFWIAQPYSINTGPDISSSSRLGIFLWYKIKTLEVSAFCRFLSQGKTSHIFCVADNGGTLTNAFNRDLCIDICYYAEDKLEPLRRLGWKTETKWRRFAARKRILLLFLIQQSSGLIKTNPRLSSRSKK